jgi:hypothetical protein
LINFSKEELDYIKEQMQNVIDIWEHGTKDDLKEYIDQDASGECLDTVLFISRNDWFLLDTVNKNDYINSKVINYCYYGLGMWYWIDAYMNTAEEVYQYVQDEKYCNLFEKIIADEEE